MFTDMVGFGALVLRNGSLASSRLRIVLGVILGMMAIAGCEPKPGVTSAGTTLDRVVVEAACGQCQFKMVGTGCDLAVRLDGESYFVDGAQIDQFGDAHATDGFCNAVRQARVTGQIKDGRFVASTFELLPAK